MLFRAETVTDYQPRRYRLRCPGCRDGVTLDSMGIEKEVGGPDGVFRIAPGQCPNCHAVVIVIASPAGDVVTAYPPETIEFDTTNLPKSVLDAFDEAVRCHAQACYVAAAIMVRKTLEELCRDHNATGKNLKERIAALGTQIVLPKALLSGLDDLRLLGNDAAHVESQTYSQVGKDEVEVALDVVKEILKATYQLDSILARLQALKAAHKEEAT